MPFEPTDRYRVRAARSKTDGIGVDNGTDDEGWVGFGMDGRMDETVTGKNFSGSGSDGYFPLKMLPNLHKTACNFSRSVIS